MLEKPDNPNRIIDTQHFKKIILKAIFLPILLSMIICFLFVLQFNKVIEENNSVRSSDKVLSLTTETLKNIIDSETGLRGYLLTGDNTFLDPWNKSVTKISPMLLELTALVKNRPQENYELDIISKLFLEWQEKGLFDVENRKKQNLKIEEYTIVSRKALMDQIRQRLDSMIKREQSIRDIKWIESEKIARNSLINIIILGIILGAILAFLSYSQLKQLSNSYNQVLNSLKFTTDHLEETVAARTTDLAATNKELEAFSYSVSHDLRSPLRGIDGFSQILMDEYGNKLDGEALKYLKFIRSGVQRMGLLIDDLINLSRLTRAEFKPQEVDISLLAREVMRELKAENKIDSSKKIEFKNFDSQIITGDPGLLRVALTNLLSNAWKYSTPKEVVKIELGKINKEGKDVFFIKDNGVGFDMKFYEKLFQPFQRLHPNDEFVGTGIGLATVSRIIRRHGGSIWAQSEPGVGSTFFFTLST